MVRTTQPYFEDMLACLWLDNKEKVGIDTIHSLKVRGKQCSISEEAKLKTEQEKVCSIAVSR